jgi:hypothetical protein
MPKMICVNCERQLSIEKSGIFVIETFLDDRPYKIWSADLWKCNSCKVEIVSGFGSGPISEHYMPNFDKVLSKAVESRHVFSYER